MSFTVFLGNLPTWVTADDIKQWLTAEDLVADSIKVIRNHETQVQGDADGKCAAEIAGCVRVIVTMIAAV